eukprot:CAMPEP_0182427128 /NCGR_PEP_ID=MMETSP1167-20130531/14933_1 /TAXON_ID=2988 /ORGANISM="Mallomonas Sp, Strain CCMP3275" /LENGTH=200 /DNA_ID=CAMNT_0024609097 /DNA_START=252 /DNA_END=854 /DNA_ORIENTATION=-
MNASVWYGAVIRGDVSTIDIGDGTIIGDRVMIHCSGITGKFPTIIGKSVIINAGAIIHGCSVADETIIGAGAIIMDGAKIEKHSILGAGSILPPGKVLPSGQYWAGSPAVFVRPLTAEEITSIPVKAVQGAELATVHTKETLKTWQMIEEDELEKEQIQDRNGYYYRRLTNAEMSVKMAEFEDHQVPGRIFNSPVSARVD